MHSYLLAISASLFWGIADFLGGLKARSLPVLHVLGLSQPVGLILLTGATIAAGSPLPGGRHALLAVVAGALSITALGLFYAATTKGSMVIVAPLASSTGALVPVLAGLARGEALTTAAAVGIGLALAGTPAAAWQPGGRARGSGGPLAALLAVTAGVAGGLWFTLMDLASAGDPLGATEVMRLTAAVIAVALFARHLRARSGTRRPTWRRPQVAPPPTARSTGNGAGAGTGRLAVAVAAPPVPATRTQPASRPAVTWLAIAALGITDAIAEISYATAATAGKLSVISPLSSLYPVVTVILAAAVLRERVRPVQSLGVLCALAGAALLAL